MLAVSAFLLAQSVSTVPSSFVVGNGHAYVASPVYFVKQVTPDERYKFSSDGSHLAYVSATTNLSPSVQESRAAKGESMFGVLKIGVWSRATGRTVDVFTPKSAKLGFEDYGFVGGSLVFSTFDQTKDGTVHQLWVSHDAQGARPIPLEDYSGCNRFVFSPDGTTMLVCSGHRAWMIDAARTVPVEVKGYDTLMGNGLEQDGRAVIFASQKDGPPAMLLLDWATGQVVPRDATGQRERVPVEPPFIFDSYRLNGVRDRRPTGDTRTEQIDAVMAPIDQEDGGYRLDIVESQGEKRRRMPFIQEMAGMLTMSRDMQSFAFVSNRLLLVRSLVRVDKAYEKKLLGEK